MHILTESVAQQKLYIVPRKDSNGVTVQLYDEMERKLVVNSNYGCTVYGGIMTIQGTFLTIKEGRFYSLKVFRQTDELIYRGRVFVTSTTNFAKYSVNPPYENIYKTEDSYDNEFIVI